LLSQIVTRLVPKGWAARVLGLLVSYALSRLNRNQERAITRSPSVLGIEARQPERLDPQMELRHLRSFAMLAETLHFGKAAQLLNISQPPLSQQIQRLERELGVELFERNRRGVILTAAGSHLLPWAKQVLQGSSDLADVADQMRRGSAGLLRIAHVGSAMLSVVPRLVRPFTQNHPNTQLSLVQMETSAQLEALRSRRIDIAFCRLLSKQEDLETMTVAREPLMAAIHTDSPYASEENEFNFSLLKNESFIGPPKEAAPTYWRAVHKLCAEYGFEPKVTHESTNILNMGGFVAAGLGVALIPESAATMPFPEVRYRRMAGPSGEVRLHMAWINQSGFPALANFVQMARAANANRSRAQTPT
jgi:DNA-binding transcriptional LysR family regulator